MAGAPHVAALVTFSLAGSALGQAANDAVLFKEQGRASYDGRQFHGRPTASGELFDQNAMTGAHPKLPLGVEVTVTDPATGR
jgi:rare lipoprotein A